MIHKISRIIVIVSLVLGSSVSLAAATTQTVLAAPPGSTVIYNIFATDAFVELADGTPIYNYGFVGGRAGVPFVFQTSFSLDGTAGGGNNSDFTSGPPNPSPGPVTADEAKLQGNASFPGPLIYAKEGDVVEIHFKNLGVDANISSPNDPHSIHLHALDVNAANDGVPETSVGAVPANLCNDGLNANDCNSEDHGGFVPGAGNVIVYMFAPKTAGTYFYHCHQEADIHVQMGMYGALVIYNRNDPAAATGHGMGKGGTLFGWKYDQDFVLLESEVDVRQHCSEQGTYNDQCLCTNPNPALFDGSPTIPTLAGQPAGWNPVDYKPQYWLLNGLSFPNTIHAAGGPVVDWSSWIAAHPGYDPFITGRVGAKSSDGTKGQKVLLRMINMGFETQPMHMHGFHAKVLGSDQRAWYWANTPFLTPWGQGEEKNTITIGSGEEYDLLLNFGLQAVTATYPNGTGGLNGTFPGGTETRYDDNGQPVSNTLTDDLAIPLPGDTLTYIGGPTVTGAVIASTTGQLFPFHNHDDYKATNNGTYPGGMFTMIEPLP